MGSPHGNRYQQFAIRQRTQSRQRYNRDEHSDHWIGSTRQNRQVVMTSRSLSGVGVGASLAGGVLIYAGIRGYSVLAVLQNLVTGKPITTNVSVTNPLSTPGSDTADVTDSNG